MLTVDDLMAGFALRPIIDHRFEAPPIDYYGSSASSEAARAVADVIAGGQLLGQAIAGAALVQPGKATKTVHLVFARSGKVSEPLELEAAPVHEWRSVGCVAVTFVQAGRAVCQGTVLTHVPDQDVITHAPDLAPRPRPGDPEVTVVERGGYEVGVIEGFDELSPEVGPPRLPVWVRFPGAPADPLAGQALTAFATNFFLIGTAMRPHAGMSVGQSHLAVSTGVLGHAITFHAPIDASGWLAIEQEAPYAGAGRTFGRGDVFDEAGHLLASFSQDGMIRGFAEAGAAGRGVGKTL
jgi:acyl-CoA thioesterase